MAGKIKETEEQLNIIRSKADVKRVIACAGSGKTMVLTNNIIDILKDGECGPDKILAITFTRNAAENIRLRVKENIKREIDSEAIDIFTFNSFGNEIISENSFELGLGKNFTLINNSRAWQILYEIFNRSEMEYLKAGKKVGEFVQELLDYIESLKNNLISANEIKEYLQNYREVLSCYKSKALKKREEESINIQKELYGIYREYEREKTKSNCIDYADQMFMPYFLLRTKKAIRARYQYKYRYIFVDEFQDTNIAQAHLLSILYLPGHNKVTVVGDDDQGIYSFRGASVENILNFHEFERFKDSHVSDFYLNTNFRSGDEIVRAAASVISLNKNRFNREFKSGKSSMESEVVFYYKKTHTEEAEEIARNIKYLSARGVKLKEMAILARRKKFGRIIRELEKNNIKFELVGGKNFFFEPEILFIISWLNVIGDMNDELSMAYILQSEKYKICDRDIFYIKRNPSDLNENIKIIDGIISSRKNHNVSREAKKRIASFLESYKLYISKSGEMELKELISQIIDDSGIINELKSTFGPASRKKIKNIESLIRVASDFQNVHIDNNLSAFITFLKDVARTDYGKQEDVEFSPENSVKIMSIHAAKGLEFEVVFLPMLWKKDYGGRNSNNRFAVPSELRKENGIWKKKKDFSSEESFNRELKDIRVEEERRIFYVGCSRAKKMLILSHSSCEDKTVLDSGARPKEIVSFFGDIIEKENGLKIIGDESERFIKEKYGKIPENIYQSFEDGFDFLKYGKKEENKITVLNEISWQDIQKTLAASVIKSSGGLKGGTENRSIIGKIGPDLNYKRIEEEGSKKTGFFPLTEILDFRRCPLLYKWKYFYMIPDRSSSTATKGEEIHKYLQNIVLKGFNNNEITEDEILTWFKDRESKGYIKFFFNSGLWNFSLVKSIMLEQLFYWRVKDYFIVGKLDRVDTGKDNKISVIDYKISDYKKGRNDTFKNNSRDLHEFQIKVYIAAFSEIYEKPVEDITGFLLYLGDGTKKPVYLKSSEVKQLKKDIGDDINKISGNDFNMDHKGHCKNCSYRDFCRFMSSF